MMKPYLRCYLIIIKKNELKIVNDLFLVRNIKIEYNGKQIEVPRRTLKIKRKVQ